jgi:hypothetical protein
VAEEESSESSESIVIPDIVQQYFLRPSNEPSPAKSFHTADGQLVSPVQGTVYTTPLVEEEEETKLVKMIFEMDGDVSQYYDAGTQYWYDSEGVLVMTYDDNGDWWMLNIANGT